MGRLGTAKVAAGADGANWGPSGKAKVAAGAEGAGLAARALRPAGHPGGAGRARAPEPAPVAAPLHQRPGRAAPADPLLISG